MKMVMAVVPRDETESVLQALIAAGHTATFTESRGGMLRQAQQMLFIAVAEDDLQAVLDIVQRSCHSQVTVEAGEQEDPFMPEPEPVKTSVGGAVVFVWDLEQFGIF